MENNALSAITTTSAPYMNNLASTYASSTDYVGPVDSTWQPSLPNYIGLTSGSTQGITNDNGPSSNPVSAINIIDRLDSTGVSFKFYMEDMPSNCYTSDYTGTGGTYDVHHNPVPYYTDSNAITACSTSSSGLDIPAGSTSCPSGASSFNTILQQCDTNLINDLNTTSSTPSFMWLTPNMCNDMHTCSGTDSPGCSVCITDGNTYLSYLIPAILTTKTFEQDPTATVIVTFDEPSSGTYGTTAVYFVVAGPGAVLGHNSGNYYTHLNLLATWELNWGLQCIVAGNDCGATPMTEFFIPDFGVSASPGSVSTQQGYGAVSQITVVSLNGFTGPVSLVATPSVNVCGFTAYFPGNPYGCNGQGNTTVSVSSGGSSTVPLYIGVCLSTPPGSYSVNVTGTANGLSRSTIIAVQVLSGPGCDSGSVAAGTLITLSNGTQVPVENLKAGMLLLSYNMTTQHFVTTTITRFANVTVHNEMTITTIDGNSITTDQNPGQKFYTMFPNGTWTLLPVTELQVGYKLYYPGLTWITITQIGYVNTGTYLMYDIYNNAPGNYIANGYLDPVK